MLDLAFEHLRAGRLDAAETASKDILAAHPDHAGALHLQGLIQWNRGDIASAIASIEHALAQPGAEALWHVDLTEMCRVAGRLDDALAHGTQAIALNPDNADAYYNLGIVHSDRGETAETTVCERRAVALVPDHAGAHFELGEALLIDGNFQAGWDEYEWRFKVTGAPPLMPVEQYASRIWRNEPLKDKTLLLIADQGFGDAIQFMRYIPKAAAQCRELIIACGFELKPLIAQIIARMPERDSKRVRVFQLWKDAPAFDCYMALSSLPRLFRTELQTIPAEVPYLRAEPDRLDHWRRRLQALVPPDHRRIGLVWSGRTGPGNTPNRAITLGALAPLATLKDVTLLSLQMGDASAQIASYYGAAPLINLAPEIRDFQDTAAIIENLDFTITIDTSVAHLVGALGQPAAILLQFAADWRWLRQRSDSPWYPSVRLYRQTRPRDWDGVVKRLMQDLTARPDILRNGWDP